MRSFVLLSMLLLLVHCAAPSTGVDRPTSAPPAREIGTDRFASHQLPTPQAPSPEHTAIQQPITPLKVVTTSRRGITFRGVVFDDRRYRLRVLDQMSGPGTQVANAAEAGRMLGGVAASNGGFFTPEGTPLGWVVSEQRISGSSNPSSLGSGVWYEDHDQKNHLVRREAMHRIGIQNAVEAIQAGPLLVERGAAVAGLEPTKRRVRVLLATDGKHGWWLSQASACSLAELAEALSSMRFANFRVQRALNLDGGSSADLWASGKLPGGPLELRSFLNRPVRNFLVVVRR